MYHHPQIHPIYKKGRHDAAVLLLHGFTGTPDLMRPLANHLHDLGFTVSAPLLAGHGSTRENLAASTWQDWYGSTKEAYRELKESHKSVCVAGLSLGGLLALKLTEDHPDALQAVACLATPLKLEKWIHLTLPMVRYSPLRFLYRYQKKMGLDIKDAKAGKNVWHIEHMPISSIHSLVKLQSEVSGKLAKVTAPILLIHARNDSTAPYFNMSLISQKVSSVVTETVTLENSFHLVTMDYEKDIVNKKIGDFFLRFV